jgi:hypothetical protein
MDVTTAAVIIGTTSAANALDVNGRVAIGSYAGTVLTSGNVFVSGNVGIGTASPQATLDVNGYASRSIPPRPLRAAVRTPAQSRLITWRRCALATGELEFCRQHRRGL